jgi:hypothetical protein
MQSDPAVEAGAMILCHHNVHQELRQFESFVAHRFGASAPTGRVTKQVRIVLADHVNTGARRADNNFRFFEYSNKPLGGDPGLPAVAGVEGRLPAAGLICGAVDGQVQLPKNFQHGLTDLGIETVDQALDKKRYFLGAVYH